MTRPIVETQMLIRKPIPEVFNAFIDPAITTKFWFTHSTGKLEVGKTVTWKWEMYGASSEVTTLKIVPDKLIQISWGEPSSMVDYEFQEFSSDSTYVIIKNYGFSQEGDALIELIKDSTGGFTTVLDGMKAWLEHGIELKLIRDKFPNSWKK